GQLGDGSRIDRATPVDVRGLPGPVATVGLGFAHTCAATAEGEVWCWGDNARGQLGDGSKNDVKVTPVRVAGLSGPAVAVTGGDLHSCAALASGVVQCWGDNRQGQLGIPIAGLPESATAL